MKIGQTIWHWNGKEIQKIKIETIHQVISEDGERIERVNNKRVDLNYIFSTKKALKDYLVKEEKSSQSHKINFFKSL
mgnify:CR=1 FL=1